MEKRATVFPLLVATISVLCGGLYSEAGTITIIQRESLGRNDLFAGSGGAVEQSDVSDSSAALTGAFSFSDSNSVAVTDANPFSNGAASAEGSISVADNVVQPSPGSLVLTAGRTANGTAIHGAGTGTGLSAQRQTFRVRFEVHDDPATYTLTGDFDPGALGTRLGNAHRVRLYRPFTSNVFVNVTSAATLNETGTLQPGRIYELDVRLNDVLGAGAGNPFDADASSLDIQFNITSVPEPSTALMGCLGALVVAGVAARRTRRRPRPS